MGQLTALESPPMLPPSVEIVCLVEGRQHVLQVGTPYSGEWPTSPPGESDFTPVERVPVPWPEQPPKSDCRDLAIVVSSSATPRALTVYAFDGYLGGDGIPADEAFHELDCRRSTSRDPYSRCWLQQTDEGLMLRLDEPSTEGTMWMAVNVTWAVPPSTPQADLGLDWATWLFAVESE